MGDTPLIQPDAELQARLFAARERTRLLRGNVLDIPRTHRIVGASAMATTIPAGSFGSRDAIATFKSRVNFSSTAPAGQVFSFGDATGAVSMWIGNTSVNFRAGGATVNTNANEVNITIAPVAGMEMTLIGMVRPDGLVGLWIPALDVVTWASTGSFSSWANNIVGDFAQAATGMPADVLQAGAPTNFALVEPLSVFYGSLPRINIGAAKV